MPCANKSIANKYVYTVNRERFAGLNFCVFRGFQEHCESFPVNIYLRTLYKLRIMALFNCCLTVKWLF